MCSIGEIAFSSPCRKLFRNAVATPTHNRSDSGPREVHDAYVHADRRLLIFDYDGTLVPFARQPQQAVPPVPVLDLLNAIHSGRVNAYCQIEYRIQ
jgi:hypothetical protein